jgi:L-ascorbate metabolism protein UlaG (beta-lactamase superfamily)
MYSSPELANILGNVMGVVFEAPGQKTIYVAGDTTWRSEVAQTLENYNPDVIILNTGDARVIGFQDSIIMGKEDTLRAYKAAQNATIISVHMDTINHTALSREELRGLVQENDIQNRVMVPADGEVMRF